MDALAASWEAGARCRRLAWLLHACVVEERHAQLVLALKAGFNPNQPRVPAGNADGGQWTGGGSGSGGGETYTSGAQRLGERASGVQLAGGGFTEDQMGLSVQGFVSGYCIGSIHRILPSEFLDMTIAEVMAEAATGNAAARRCMKLLRQQRFRK